MQDYHIHSSYSGDSDMPMVKACEEAVNVGLKEIAFTDHVDLDWPGKIKFETIDIKKYLAEIGEMQKRFSNISIKKGLEIGLQPKTVKSSELLVNQYELDYIIASVHCVNCIDIADVEFFDNKSIRQAYEGYFNEVLHIVTSFNTFCTLGHIDLLKRYIPDSNSRTIKYNDYADILDEILINLIKKSKGLEVNTSGLRYGLNSFHPTLDFLKRYKELGGEIITVGSDSHHIAHIGFKNSDAIELVKEAGFKYLSYFKNLQSYLVRI